MASLLEFEMLEFFLLLKNKVNKSITFIALSLVSLCFFFGLIILRKTYMKTNFF